MGGRKGGSAAEARPRAGARCRFRASRARAVRAPGAAGQVDRRFQPLRQKEAAQEGPASPGRGEGVENHEAGGCARAVALLESYRKTPNFPPNFRLIFRLIDFQPNP